MLGQIDRFLKQAVVDKNPMLVSAALVSGIHLFKTGNATPPPVFIHAHTQQRQQFE